ncbi:MAG: hypothetical protein QXL27_02450 [Candidatus Bathyarchaeia archaeon]
MELIDISDTIILTPRHISRIEAKAIAILVEEVEKRTGLKLPVVHQWDGEDLTVILVSSEESLKNLNFPYLNLLDGLEKPGKEGYRILVEKLKNHPVIFIVGRDERGVLYGVGRFLRKLIWGRGFIKIHYGLKISSTPAFPLRGHQLGYRPKSNTYDAWSIEQFDQYIRELTFFGVNAIEIVPPRTDDEPINSLMKIPPLEMMAKLSQIIDSYGLDVWIWYPNMFSDSEIVNEENMKRELTEREEIFSRLPRIDAVFIPGGDPGILKADELFQWAEKVAAILRKYHPNAKIWLSPQFPETPSDSWYAEFYKNVKRRPDWLGGIVFGPRVKTPLPELRRIIPDEYPIRHYPDITHSIRCQYPVPNWDVAFAITLGRECINPRPKAEKHIHNLFAPYTIGSISYSEGVNDDVNKFIWSDQDWNPNTPVIETLRDYVRVFISSEWADEIAHCIMALEDNWIGPAIANDSIEVTLRQWQELEKKVPQEVLENWRFQMGLLRAYYDAYVRRRLIYETELEEEAIERLESANSIGSLRAIEEAEKILRKAQTEPVAVEYRKKCEELADKLFKNIGLQLSVKRHQAANWERGAFMDDIDMPLNNMNWLLAQFQIVRKMEDEDQRLKAIDRIINRVNPGPGGFYENFGSYVSINRLFEANDWRKDPGFISSRGITFATPLLHLEGKRFKYDGVPLAWVNKIFSPYQHPLTISYDGLDPTASYRIRITYVGFSGDEVKLLADEKYIIHDFINITGKCITIECSIPQEATIGGKLNLTWIAKEGSRGVSVAELWIMKTRNID